MAGYSLVHAELPGSIEAAFRHNGIEWNYHRKRSDDNENVSGNAHQWGLQAISKGHAHCVSFCRWSVVGADQG
jgi:hypothetical protein